MNKNRVREETIKKLNEDKIKERDILNQAEKDRTELFGDEGKKFLRISPIEEEKLIKSLERDSDRLVKKHKLPLEKAVLKELERVFGPNFLKYLYQKRKKQK